jgi:hypothetical protein
MMKQLMIPGMKQLWCLLACMPGLLPVNATAQTFASEAAAIAHQRTIEEEFKRLNAVIDGLLDHQALLQTRIDRLTTDLERAREETQRANRNWVTQEELKKFAQEIDRKREADRKLILDAIDDLGKVVRAPVPQRGVPAADRPLHEFTVGAGQTLMDIINAYNEDYRAQGKGRISLQDVRKANPNLQNPDRIVPGQKILIPEPAK